MKGPDGLAKRYPCNLGRYRGKGNGGLSGALGPAAGRAIVQATRHVENVRENAPVDPDGDAGERQQLRAIRIQRGLDLGDLEPSQGGQRLREQAETALAESSNQIGRAKLASGRDWSMSGLIRRVVANGSSRATLPSAMRLVRKS